MNILFATDASIERAGICMFMLHWIEEINNNFPNNHITVYFRKGNKDDSVLKQYQRLGVKVVLGELPEKQTSVSRKNRNRVKTDIRTILHERKYDILHINSSAAGYTSIVLSESLKTKVPVRIIHSHGKNIGNGIKKAYLWALKIYNRTMATKLASCSIDAGKYLFGSHVEENPKWMLIPNTIRTEIFAFNEQKRKEKRNELNISDGTIVLGAAGQLTEIKNHQFILSVLNQLKKDGINSIFALFGEGEERNKLEKQIREYGLEKEVFMPGITSEVSSWLSAFDLYVMPSLTEGLPIGAIEAQANGLCCLLSDRIPADVDITPNVYHLPINQGVNCWVDFIRNHKPQSNQERQLGAEKMRKAGYDQSKTKEYIAKLYNI